MLMKINGIDYFVNEGEFTQIPHVNYNNLVIRAEVGEFERIISLINEIGALKVENLITYNTTHGGFVPINCSSSYQSVFVVETHSSHIENTEKNIHSLHLSNLHLSNLHLKNHIQDIPTTLNSSLIYSVSDTCLDMDFIRDNKPILLTVYNEAIARSGIYAETFALTNTNMVLYIPASFSHTFKTEFSYFITEKGELEYDNLNHLCIMVKNGGAQFEQMLLENMPFFDRWTILDTGSTDETLDIIQRVLVGKKKGSLHQEPFINFKDSRNRCLNLVGNSCKFITMLDDTYVIKGQFREFLNEVRGDQIATSFTLYINSDDTTYGSNRVIKSNSKLRYIHRIHEVITSVDNINIVIPREVSVIEDKRFDYMEKRTMERKQLDLKLLYEEVEENPYDPRAYYYLAQTYNLLEDYEKAFLYFMKRAEYSNTGFVQERVDAMFEAGRIANFKLNKPWSECEELYNKCYRADESRPESLYFIGIHYYLEDNYGKAFGYFKKAFEVGFPVHCQYSLKPTLSFHFLPKFLSKICYGLNEYELGKQASKLFLNNNTPQDDSYAEILSWYNIYDKLTVYNVTHSAPAVPKKPIFCFHADGGFNNWSGRSILTVGVGGSETYIIELARHIQRSGHFDVYVFCNCLEEDLFEGVVYKPLNEYYPFITQNYIHSCIVSRFSEYLPVTFKGWTENVYLVLHDLTPSGVVIPKDKKLKKIFCLTEWHVDYFTQIFPALKSMTVPFYYGIDFQKFNNDSIVLKQQHKFIYSSFPNRGLLPLLQMWPKIHEFQPMASLHIYCDVDGKWVNNVEGAKMQQIKELMKSYDVEQNNMNIYYHGWVNKQELADSWSTADVWFYPCTFMETFCLTALEAALSKTLVITNHLAALQNTVGHRGVIINGDPNDTTWQEAALAKIKKYLSPENNGIKNSLIQQNYEWASKLSWENQATKLLNEHILQEKLEYKGMYNWTNDAPVGHKQYFLDAIEYFNNNYAKIKSDGVKVLEVGTYTGTSLINIIKLIPNSIGFGVDMWCNYDEISLLESVVELGVESSFYKNIRTEGLEDRITGIKGDSYNVLFDMMRENKMFDFIYIDGSHLAFDCYLDLILSWKLLSKGGILAIDDYTYNTHKPMTDSPFEGVNHFLKKHQHELRVLHKGYRVFVEKLYTREHV